MPWKPRQVRVDDELYAEIEKAAERRGKTTAEWRREAYAAWLGYDAAMAQTDTDVDLSAYFDWLLARVKRSRSGINTDRGNQ